MKKRTWKKLIGKGSALLMAFNMAATDMSYASVGAGKSKAGVKNGYDCESEFVADEETILTDAFV